MVNRLGGGPALPIVPAAAGERARPGRRADPGAERGDAGPPGADRAVRPALVPRRRHQRPSPARMLTTIYRPDAKAHVREAAIGTPLRTLLGDDAEAQAWLVGGYHGTWLPMPGAAGITLDNASLRRFGAAAGAGVLAALPSDRCGLTEAARVTGYLAAESAGQCGPCLNGLPRIAAALAELAGPGHRRADRGRPATLVGPGRRPRRLQPPGRHGPLRPQRADRLRAGNPAARPRPVLGDEPQSRSCRCRTGCPPAKRTGPEPWPSDSE